MLNSKITHWTRNYSVSQDTYREVLDADGKSLSTGIYIIEGFVSGTGHNVYHRWWIFINTVSGEYRAHQLEHLDNGYLSLILGFHESTKLLISTNVSTQNYTVTLKVTKE